MGCDALRYLLLLSFLANPDGVSSTVWSGEPYGKEFSSMAVRRYYSLVSLGRVNRHGVLTKIRSNGTGRNACSFEF